MAPEKYKFMKNVNKTKHPIHFEPTTRTTPPKRLLPLKGAYNVRDLGGYPTVQQTRVKWDKLFRAGDLYQLTQADLDTLAQVSIKTYVDFRDKEEIALAPDKKPATLAYAFALPIFAANILGIHKTVAEQAPTLLVDLNKVFVRECQQEFKTFFQILQQQEHAPLLFHCSAGKDRTGFAAALVLGALGVDQNTLMQDYLLSNLYLKGKYDREVAANPILEPLIVSKAAYLQAALDTINTEYGGMDHYLTQYLAVDLDKMRTLYTE